MAKYTVSISSPCNENWNKMTQLEKGMHCSACNKLVVDFSTMHDQEIVKYLLKNKNTCGRFNNNQLNKPIILLNNNKTKWPAIAAMLIAGLVSVVPNKVNANLSLVEKHVPSFIKDVEPDKSGQLYFTVNLLNNFTNEKIYYGSININNIGKFYDNGKGSILIAIDSQVVSKSLIVNIEAGGYISKQFSITLNELKNKTSANVYLNKIPLKQIKPPNNNNEIQHTAGTVEINEIFKE